MGTSVTVYFSARIGRWRGARAQSPMPLTFPNIGNAAEFVGRTPGPRGTPSSRSTPTDSNCYLGRKADEASALQDVNFAHARVTAARWTGQDGLSYWTYARP